VFANEARPLLPRMRLAIEVLGTYVRVRRANRHADVRRALHDLRTGPRVATVEPAAVARTAARLAAATQRVLRLIPADTRCLNQSLVLSALLARRGIDSRVVIGVSGTSESFGAHAWVEVEGRPVLPRAANRHARLVEL
jgi:transglutaminase superfamily protein